MKYLPSMIASGAVYFAMKTLKNEDWNETMIRNTKIDESSVRGCAKEMAILIQNSEKSSLQAVRKKFSSAKFFENPFRTYTSEAGVGLPSKKNLEVSKLF